MLNSPGKSGGKNGGTHCKTALFMGVNRRLLLFLYTLNLY
ncbi:hypothetical protein VCRA2119O147_60082 [Vibrio crassostreae]|nr:hypothetical protein VCRA2112O187_100018 [Vibrio crassostreae]CAK1752159.1 hypothetical protein VCRA2116O233_140024 [Vibrio crassostreae]CAK1752733.1 hypothetical protein VCRA2113O193_130083 [Vibrio crassostreae]CAK1761924.1 hypothetical protein VCRA2112E186_140082 [Vibrio crassostreae]CAK1772865.1 hypothetical protein VCRA2112O185_140085 [Vibrio crassostreae]